jgi:hypothetical protein
MPVQVRKFDLDMVNEARKAAGLEPTAGLAAFEPEEVIVDDENDLVDTDSVFSADQPLQS